MEKKKKTDKKRERKKEKREREKKKRRKKKKKEEKQQQKTGGGGGGGHTVSPVKLITSRVKSFRNVFFSLTYVTLILSIEFRKGILSVQPMAYTLDAQTYPPRGSRLNTKHSGSR